MDLEKLEKLSKCILPELLSIINSGYGRYSLRSYAATEVKFRNLLRTASQTLPEYEGLFKDAYKRINTGPYHLDELTVKGAEMLLTHFIEIIQIEKASITKIKEMKIFESAEEKLKEAAVSFRKDDYSSTFRNLNTCLELILKDKLGIPTTITSINTSTIIDILVSQKIEPYRYLAEVKKPVLAIDNNIKHKGYSPSKIESISGMKTMEDLISKLREKEIEVTEEVRKKIFEGL